ncbi:hypothetical protein B0H10DRAFT_2445348, partial [Mycena sp. CBHHK59/15]
MSNTSNVQWMCTRTLLLPAGNGLAPTASQYPLLSKPASPTTRAKCELQSEVTRASESGVHAACTMPHECRWVCLPSARIPLASPTRSVRVYAPCMVANPCSCCTTSSAREAHWPRYPERNCCTRLLRACSVLHVREVGQAPLSHNVTRTYTYCRPSLPGQPIDQHPLLHRADYGWGVCAALLAVPRACECKLAAPAAGLGPASVRARHAARGASVCLLEQGTLCVYSAQRKAAHAFCKLGGEDRVVALYMRLLHTEKQNKETQDQLQSMQAHLNSVGEFCMQGWKPSKEQA